MAFTKYEYAVIDTLNDAVASDKLTKEINDSTISSSVDHINTNAGQLYIWLSSAITAPEKTTLDGLVAAHDGIQLIPDFPALEFAESESGTTSSKLQDKAALAPGEISPLNKHLVEWYCEVNNSSTTGRTEIEVAYDGNVIAAPGIRSRHEDDWIPVSGFQILDAGVEISVVTLKFKRLKAGTSKVRRARLKVTEVE